MPETLDSGAFKHILVPIGVVIALGVARIVTAVANYVQYRDRVRFSVAHAVWCTIVFLWFVGLWWIMYGFRQVEGSSWSYFSLIFLLLGPGLLYLTATLLLPDVPDQGELDLTEPLDRLARPILLSLASVLLWLMTAEVTLLNEPLIVLPKRLLQGSVLTLFGIGMLFPSRKMVTVLGAITLPVVLIAFATVRDTLA